MPIREVLSIAFDALRAHYVGRGFTSLDYRAVPSIYHQRPAQDDLYCLFRMNATRYRADLSAAIDLAQPGPMSKGRRSDISRGRRVGHDTIRGADAITLFWPLLGQTLEEGHAAAPVHSREEMIDLQQRFPDRIRCVVARMRHDVVAGAVLFVSDTVTHTQYLAANEAGRENGILASLIAAAIDEARTEGRRYFDFGTSNRDQGRVLNQALYDFKDRFGAGGVVHECYRLQLSESEN